MDEDLLCQGLALNDDLQRVLAKHDDIARGAAATVKKANTLQALVDIDDSAGTSADASTLADPTCSSRTTNAAPVMSNGSATSSARDPFIDLLSEDFDTPATQDSLALAPVTDPLADSASEQNALVISSPHADPGLPQLQPQQQHLAVYSNGSIANFKIPQYEQAAYVQETHANPPWNGHIAYQVNHQQQEYYGNDQGGSLPPPPWETQETPSSQVDGSQTQLVQSDQLVSMNPGMPQNGHPGSMHLSMMHNQQLGMFPPTMQSNMQAGVYYQPMQGSYAYTQHQETQYYDQRSAYTYANRDEISQRMYGLSMRDSSAYTNASQSYQMSNMQQPAKPPKPEDKLFGDLVSMARSKQNKSSDSL